MPLFRRPMAHDKKPAAHLAACYITIYLLHDDLASPAPRRPPRGLAAQGSRRVPNPAAQLCRAARAPLAAPTRPACSLRLAAPRDKSSARRAPSSPRAPFRGTWRRTAATLGKGQAGWSIPCENARPARDRPARRTPRATAPRPRARCRITARRGPSSTTVSRISSAAMPVSMGQNGTGQRRSLQSPPAHGSPVNRRAMCRQRTTSANSTRAIRLPWSSGPGAAR